MQLMNLDTQQKNGGIGEDKEELKEPLAKKAKFNDKEMEKER
jgi:hypothetical protein